MLSASSLASRVVPIFIINVAAASSVDAALPDDACSLLTATQVSTAIGVTMGEGAFVTPTFRKTCTWSATVKDGGTVTLNLQSLDQFQSEKKSASYGQSVAAISGIGDEAYFYGTDSLVSLIVKRGNLAFKVAVYSHIPVEKRKDEEKSLAQQVISHL